MDNRPEVDEDLQEVWDCFFELTNSRPMGQVPCGIPPTHVEAWLRINGITDVDSRVWFWKLICDMDEAWLDNLRSKIASK